VFADSWSRQAAVGAASEQDRPDRHAHTPVEDNEINQQVAMELLEGVGASVTVADDGKLALDTLVGGPVPAPFDVVLMDLQMPVMDGFQATAAIRGDPRFESLTIVAMTAHATLEEKERCLAAGMNDHVAKPIDPGLLYQTLGRYHRGTSRAARPESAARTNGPSRVSRASTPRPVSPGRGERAVSILKLLRQFAEQQADAVKEIARSRGGIASATPATAHTLKSVSGTLARRRCRRRPRRWSVRSGIAPEAGDRRAPAEDRGRPRPRGVPIAGGVTRTAPAPATPSAVVIPRRPAPR
jgi:two-component system sensor histidine kinase/response regulator